MLDSQMVGQGSNHNSAQSSEFESVLQQANCDTEMASSLYLFDENKDGKPGIQSSR